jgi:hypothetical protein
MISNRGKNKLEGKHDDIDRPSMESYELPVDGEAEIAARNKEDKDK